MGTGWRVVFGGQCFPVDLYTNYYKSHKMLSKHHAQTSWHAEWSIDSKKIPILLSKGHQKHTHTNQLTQLTHDCASFPTPQTPKLLLGIIACWMIYPALTADFKKSVGLPYDPKDLAA